MPIELPPLSKLWLPPRPAIIRSWHEPLTLASLLPGMFPSGIAAAEAPLTTLTQVGSGTSLAANGSITSSVSIAAGDLLVIYGQGGTDPTAFPPGFTSAITMFNTAALKEGLFYRIATGADIGTSVTGFSGSGSGRNLLYVFRGDGKVKLVTVNDVATDLSNAGDPAAQIVNASGAVVPLIVFGTYRASQAISPRTMSPAKDGEINADTFQYLAYKLYNSSPANVTVDMADHGVNHLCSCYLGCS